MEPKNVNIRAMIAGRGDLLDGLQRCSEDIRAIAVGVSECLRAGGAVYACGNGGSATQAEHFVAELVGNFQKQRPALRAFALTQNSGVMTSLSNDFSFEDVFARQLEGLAKPGDCLLALSTSGNSPNVVRACQQARSHGARAFALTGESGGRVAEYADVTLRYPDTNTARIQEMHLVVIHLVCEMVEAAIFPDQTS